METHVALKVILDLVNQMTLPMKGSDIPTVFTALKTLHEHAQSLESSTTQPEVIEDNAA